MYVPKPSSDFGAVRMQVDCDNDPMGKWLRDQIQAQNKTVKRIFRIETPNLRGLYDNHAKQIEQENNHNVNEKDAWHGTSNTDDVRDGIASRGFDNR